MTSTHNKLRLFKKQSEACVTSGFIIFEGPRKSCAKKLWKFGIIRKLTWAPHYSTDIKFSHDHECIFEQTDKKPIWLFFGIKEQVQTRFTAGVSVQLRVKTKLFHFVFWPRKYSVLGNGQGDSCCPHQHTGRALTRLISQICGELLSTQNFISLFVLYVHFWLMFFFPKQIEIWQRC